MAFFDFLKGKKEQQPQQSQQPQLSQEQMQQLLGMLQAQQQPKEEEVVVTREMVMTAMDECKGDLRQMELDRTVVEDMAMRLDAYRTQFSGVSAVNGNNTNLLYMGLHQLFDKDLPSVLKYADKPEFSEIEVLGYQQRFSVFQVIEMAISAINSRKQNVIDQYALHLLTVCYQASLCEIRASLEKARNELLALEQERSALRADRTLDDATFGLRMAQNTDRTTVLKGSVATLETLEGSAVQQLSVYQQKLIESYTQAVYIDPAQFKSEMENIRTITTEEMDRIGKQTAEIRAEQLADARRREEINKENRSVDALTFADERRMERMAPQQQVQPVEQTHATTAPVTEENV